VVAGLVGVVSAAAAIALDGAAPAGAGGAPDLGSQPRTAATAAQDAPDPEVVVHPGPDGTGEQWTLLATNAVVGDEEANVPAWRSTDRGATWAYAGDALPQVGPWARPGRTWAPGVLPLPGGGYALYYTARARDGDVQCIGVATSDRPTGPYVDDRSDPLVCQLFLGGSIDADAHVAPDGRPFLAWKSDENGASVPAAPRLWAQPLDRSGLALTGSPALLVRGLPGPAGVVEGPSLFTRPDGATGLVWSAGWWESAAYRMRQARCATPLGPCTPLDWPSPDPDRGGGGGAVFEPVDGNGGGAVAHHLAYHRWVGPPAYDEGGVREATVAPLAVPDA
jgi:hypothetical protein